MPVVRSKIVNPKNGPVRISRGMNLKEFWERRNRVLILRGCGGLGDIFMHRMMFEDFKRLMPDAEIHFACPRYYHDAVADHPFVDRLLDSETVNRNDYLVHYNTSTACGRAEMKLAPFAGPHRSDIWAAHCGLRLTKHDMHIRLTPEEQATGRALIEAKRDRAGPAVVIAPVSAMFNKNLQETQVVGLVRGLRQRGLCPVGLHNTAVWEFSKHEFPAITTNRLREWMGVLHQADYVVSVDTAAFHCAGGMNKPLVGVFTFINAAAYGKYFGSAELLQGPCPVGHAGCYNWGACPATADSPKPCLKDITAEMILNKVDTLVAKRGTPSSTD